MADKSRKAKQFEYEQKYGLIPVDYMQRLDYMYALYNLSEKKSQEIINIRDEMLSSLYYTDINLVLFQEPEATPRHRYRIINRTNFIDAAIHNSPFVHVYQPNAKEDSVYMKRLGEVELNDLKSLICTPIKVVYTTFHKTPTAYNVEQTFLAEIGLIKPIIKPDWDNMGKKYSDMSNHNIWLDDSFVMTGTVDKFYSILPRVEIQIKYLNVLYNKHQFNAVTKRKDFNEHTCEVDYFKRG